MSDISDITWDITQDGEGLGVYRAQDIPKDHMAWLQACRDESSNNLMGEVATVASIPAILVVQWLNEGFDMFKASHKEIIARLKRQGFGGFMTTNKRI